MRKQMAPRIRPLENPEGEAAELLAKVGERPIDTEFPVETKFDALPAPTSAKTKARGPAYTTSEISTCSFDSRFRPA